MELSKLAIAALFSIVLASEVTAASPKPLSARYACVFEQNVAGETKSVREATWELKSGEGNEMAIGDYRAHVRIQNGALVLSVGPKGGAVNAGAAGEGLPQALQSSIDGLNGKQQERYLITCEQELPSAGANP